MSYGDQSLLDASSDISCGGWASRNLDLNGQQYQANGARRFPGVIESRPDMHGMFKLLVALEYQVFGFDHADDTYDYVTVTISDSSSGESHYTVGFALPIEGETAESGIEFSTTTTACDGQTSDTSGNTSNSRDTPNETDPLTEEEQPTLENPFDQFTTSTSAAATRSSPETVCRNCFRHYRYRYIQAGCVLIPWNGLVTSSTTYAV